MLADSDRVAPPCRSGHVEERTSVDDNQHALATCSRDCADPVGIRRSLRRTCGGYESKLGMPITRAIFPPWSAAEIIWVTSSRLLEASPRGGKSFQFYSRPQDAQLGDMGAYICCYAWLSEGAGQHRSETSEMRINDLYATLHPVFFAKQTVRGTKPGAGAALISSCVQLRLPAIFVHSSSHANLFSPRTQMIASSRKGRFAVTRSKVISDRSRVR